MGLPGRIPTRLCIAHLRWQLQRSFSSSSICRKNGPLATFPKTSSPELDEIVNTFRETVFFPNHIPKFDREMIYQPSKHFYLTGEEPVKTRVHVVPAVPVKKQRKAKGEEPPAKRDQTESKKLSRATAPAIYPQKKPPLPKETFVMNPININSDVPRLRSNYRQMLKLMSLPSDFAIIPGFLRELNMTRLKVTPRMLAGTVRRAAELDRVDVVMHAFQSHDSIGLQINHPKIATQLMQAIVRHAANGYWTQDRLDKALLYSDSVMLMLQDPRHHFHYKSKPFRDSLELPEVWGAAMALSAIRHLIYGPRDLLPHRYDLRKLAEGYVERLNFGHFGDGTSSWKLQNGWLADWAPAIVGTKFAIQALGASDPIAMKLQLATAALDDAATTAASKIAEGDLDANQERLGLKMVRIMETALEVKAPPAQLNEDTFVIQSDGDAVAEAGSPANQNEDPEVVETVTDESDVHPEKKDSA